MQLKALLAFAARAYRRPLSKAERDDLLAYYHSLREKEGLSHEDAIRDCIVSVLMSPDFLLPHRSAGRRTRRKARSSRPPGAWRFVRFPTTPWPAGSAISYGRACRTRNCWGTRRRATCKRPNVLLAEVHRMLKDPRAAGLATEFGGNWLDFRHFEQINTVDRERFPNFTPDLREAMFQEPIRLIEDVMHNNRSVLDMLYGNYTFVNPVLAKHYGMPPVQGDNDTWVRVDDAGTVPARRAAADGGVPDGELARAAHQSGEARPLGGEGCAGRSDSAAAAGGAGIAAGRIEDRSLRAGHAGAASRPIRCAPRATRASTYSDWRLRITVRWAMRAPRTWPGAPVDTKVSFPGGFTGDGFEAILDYVREHRQNEYRG